MTGYFDLLIGLLWAPVALSFMTYRQPNYSQPPTTNSSDAEAARQKNAAAASADATANGRESTNQGGRDIAYAKQQDEQRDLMKTKRSGAASSELDV